jgi:sterol desaturase/sphingolipid hydroxylase (fatty acid hydroxylase superfamily)
VSNATRPKLIRSEEPIRLFQSDFLEFFTHIHPAVVVVIWLPVVVGFLVAALVRRPAGLAGALSIPIGMVAGLFLWTFAEYTLHRFVFHFRPRNAWQERVAFLMHGVHHATPKDKTRLVMPPAVSVPLALVFYGLFWLVLGVALGAHAWIAPTFAGFIAGYLTYDMIHYATHHIRMRRGVGKALARHHLQHHGRLCDKHFGVSSPLWDVVFRTMG